MISSDQIAELRKVYGEATSGEWSPGCLASDSTCNCAYVFSDHHMGSIATVSVDNGLNIVQGGNDSPSREEAIANLKLITMMKNTLIDLLDELEMLRGTK